MPDRHRRPVGRLIRLGPKRAETLEFFLVVVPDAQARFVRGEESLDLYVTGDKALCARFVRETDQAAEPGRSFAGHFCDAARSPFLVADVIELDSERRLKGFEGTNVGRRSRHVENAEWIVRQARVAPGPEHAAAMYSVLNTVATEDSAFLPVTSVAEFLCFAEDASARDAAKPLGNDGAID